MAGHDAILVGGGHNALVCAGLLARAGLKVLVLEAADRVGGAARSVELAEGRVRELTVMRPGAVGR